MAMAMSTAAYNGHADVLRHLITKLPRHHWQGTTGPWEPLVTPLLDTIPQEHK